MHHQAASSECPAGYDVEYSGFLFGGHYTHRRTESVCVNRAPRKQAPDGAGTTPIYPAELESAWASAFPKYSGKTQFEVRIIYIGRGFSSGFIL